MVRSCFRCVLGGALKNGGADTCKGSASGYDACVKEAADACSSDPACYSFIVPSVGQPGTNWATYAASVGNAAPNNDWDLYHKTVSKRQPVTAPCRRSLPSSRNALVCNRNQGENLIDSVCWALLRRVSCHALPALVVVLRCRIRLMVTTWSGHSTARN